MNSITTRFGITTATTWLHQLAGPCQSLPSLVTHPDFLDSRNALANVAHCYTTSPKRST
ncbi:hypothetical protein CY34DRAFT_716900 [Suillus luteus UH-Slu-Lm8-n1]|uniref:Uncharacterized protein n=1 Tax=Suillus luteus UH-Slu-Lm8-n1 TaxID=930992 RepID=A0A0D0BJA1_9AGAM|nr:hypothetical protein CY34DRAFT_716900 [Suillus luteus UH-Slu-Lm8-n1]